MDATDMMDGMDRKGQYRMGMRSRRALVFQVAGVFLLAAGCATQPPKSDTPTSPPPPSVKSELEERAAQLKAAATADPNNPDNFYQLGNVLFDLGNYDDARGAYESTLALKPDYTSAQCNLGLCLKRLGHIEEAIAAYRKALLVDPKDTTTLWNLVSALDGAGETEQELEVLQTLSAAYPDDLRAQVELGHLLFRLDRYNEAATSFKKVLGQNQGAAADYYNLGLCYFSMENWDEAITTWLAGSAHAPKDPSLLKGLAVAYWKRGDFDQAWQYVAKCQTQNVPLDADFLRDLQNDSGRTGP